jgi:hypothetical protein
MRERTNCAPGVSGGAFTGFKGSVEPTLRRRPPWSTRRLARRIADRPGPCGAERPVGGSIAYARSPGLRRNGHHERAAAIDS